MITQFTPEEAGLFSKYYGEPHLEVNDEYWQDVFDIYSKTGDSIPMPMGYNPITVRFILDSLVCRAGECGLCCRYPVIPVKQFDIDRILASGIIHPGELDTLLKKDGKDLYFDGTDGCPMLENNVCRIYHCRPDVCYLFPIQTSIPSIADGKKVNQLTVKLKCQSVLKVVRNVFTNAVKQQGAILVPNLQLVKRKTEV